MRTTLTLARIMGIDIRVHFSWFFIFVLIVASLTFGYMPSQYPGLSQETYLLIGIVAAGILFTSVLLHELSHAYVAIRKGVRIPSIVLFFFGGVAQMASEPRRPGDEIRIAIAGPLSSFAIGGVLLFFWLFAQAAHLGVALSAVFEYGAYINFIVGAFNLLPAFPLDGGRVLRAGLWRKSGDMLKATFSAARISMVLATAMMFGSFAVFILTGSAAGIWLFLIGLFLRSSAEASLQQTMLKQSLQGVLAGEVSRYPVTVPPYTTLKEFHETYADAGQKRFPVVHNSVLLGIFEPGDMKRIAKERWNFISVGRVMRRLHDYLVISQNIPVNEILVSMAERQTLEAFLVSDGMFEGMISYADLIRYARAKMSGINNTSS